MLERVLGEIDNATNLASVNGTFANIAENVGSATEVNSYAGTAPTASGDVIHTGGTLTQEQFDENLARLTVDQTYASVAGDLVYYNTSTGQVIRSSQYNQLSAADQALFSTVAAGSYLIQAADGTVEIETSLTDLNAELAARTADLAAMNGYTQSTTYTGGIAGINGSINNTIDGITDVTQQAIAGTTTASEWNLPTMNFGNMATTALGAVNTGDITLGVNSAVDEAKTSTTNAISAVVDQIGGSADTGAIILNIASNMTGVNGSINNVMTEVNGTLGNLSTTALGAVNTGTIVSGVDAAVAGIVGSTSGGSNGATVATN